MTTSYLTPDDIRIAEKNGISERVAKQRFYVRGWEKDRAITRPLGERGLYPAELKMARENGIKRMRFYKRIKSGWNVIDAATIPIRGKVK